jgi:translin
MVLLNKASFHTMKKELEDYDSKRENLIKTSRDVLKSSKLVIFALQRGATQESQKQLKVLEVNVKRINMIAKKHVFLKKEGSYNIAMQEFVEAACFYNFINNKKIPSNKTLGVSAENYLAGLCDLTGELGRKAVLYATERRFHEVQRIKLLVEEIFGEILKLNPRNGELRKKSDAVKWNLKKVEEIMYDAVKHLHQKEWLEK